MESVKITFHRTYEFDISELDGRLKDKGYEDVEINEDLLKEEAEIKAREILADEMTMFTENTEDFVSATIELIQ